MRVADRIPIHGHLWSFRKNLWQVNGRVYDRDKLKMWPTYVYLPEQPPPTRPSQIILLINRRRRICRANSSLRMSCSSLLFFQPLKNFLIALPTYKHNEYIYLSTFDEIPYFRNYEEAGTSKGCLDRLGVQGTLQVTAAFSCEGNVASIFGKITAAR